MILRLMGCKYPSASRTRTEMLRCSYSSDGVDLPCSCGLQALGQLLGVASLGLRQHLTGH